MIQIGLVTVAVGLGLAVWSPAPLQTAVIRAGLEAATASSPYRISVQGTAGHWWKRLVLRGVRVETARSGREVATVRELIIELDWLALRRGRIHLKELALIEPRVDAGAVLPAAPAPASDPPARPFWINRFTLVNGRVTHPRAQITRLHARGAIAPEEWTLRGVAAPSRMRFAATWKPAVERFEGSLDAPSLRLAEIWRDPRAVQAGTLQLHVWAAGQTRQLEKARADVAIAWRPSPHRTAPVTLNARLRQGRVDATARVELSSQTPSVQGVPGRVQLEAQAWGPWRHPELRLRLNAEDIGLAAWQLDLKGDVAWRRRWARLGWSDLRIQLPDWPAFESTEAGTLTWSPQRQWVERLAMSNGQARLEMPQGSYAGGIVSARVRAALLDPSFIRGVAPGVKLDGAASARADLTVEGRLPQPDITGTMAARFERIRVPAANLDFRDVRLEARTRDRQLVFDGAADTGDGTITLSGSSAQTRLQLALDATALGLRYQDVFKGKADAHLRLAGTWLAPDLQGEIALREGTYTAPKKKKKPANAQEPDIAAAPSAASTATARGHWLATRMDVRTHWPGRVWYRDGLSKIETKADLRALKSSGQAQPTLNGQVEIVRGTYDVYGRTFVLRSGALQFAGTPEINPLLQLRAEYKARGTNIFIDVGGTAKTPELTLSSNPPLREQDILSVLVFGQPTSRVSGTGQGSADSQEQVQALAGTVLGGMLTSRLREYGMDVLALDEVRIEPGDETHGSTLSLGRYVGERLFVRYGQPLDTSAARTFSAEYELTPRWDVVGQTGSLEGTLLDFRFRYPLLNR